MRSYSASLQRAGRFPSFPPQVCPPPFRPSYTFRFYDVSPLFPLYIVESIQCPLNATTNCERANATRSLSRYAASNIHPEHRVCSAGRNFADDRSSPSSAKFVTVRQMYRRGAADWPQGGADIRRASSLLLYSVVLHDADETSFTRSAHPHDPSALFFALERARRRRSNWSRHT